MLKSKLPKEIRDSLAKQLKTLFTGKVEKVKINVSLTIPLAVGYGWAEGTTASYNRLDNDKHVGDFYSLIEKKTQQLMQPKLVKVNSRITKFYQRLDKLCVKYDTNSDDEFNQIINDYKLNDCANKWY